MKYFLLISIITALGTMPVSAQQGVKPPNLVKKAEPDYAGLTSGYAVDFTPVAMVIDSHGVPFSLEAKSGSLPDVVVQALAGWRYEPATQDGKATAFLVNLIVPVRRVIDERRAHSFMHRGTSLTQELKSEMDSGAALDAEGARKLEEQVKSNPEDLGARSSLLACYAAECGGMDAAERSRARLQHISWLAENHPDSGVLGTRAAMINVNDGPLPDAAGYQKVRQIWLDQLAKEKNQPQVLVNAVNFLRLGDFAKTEALALAARGHHPSSQIWLGNLYGLAVLGVTGIDLQSGLPAAAKPYVEFTSRARVMLAQTSDAKVLLSALSTITAGARTLQAAGQLPPGYSTVCEKMLERARTFYAAVSETCAVSPPVPEPQRSTNPSVRPSVLIPSTIRVGGTVMGAKIRKQPKPSYPDAAKIMNFQGRVRFSATIGKQGKVEDLELLTQLSQLGMFEAGMPFIFSKGTPKVSTTF